MQISECFVSLQGEGWFTGTPAAFIRLAGCNLQCPFCDTDFHSRQTLSEEEVARWVAQTGMHHVVLTGGEPALQLSPTLIELLHEAGLFVQIETNGTVPLPEEWGIDWITCSPKFGYVAEAPLRLSRMDELKVVFTPGMDLSPYDNIPAQVRFLQPCDMGDPARNDLILRETVNYCLAHPAWRLSLQTHKILGIR